MKKTKRFAFIALYVLFTAACGTGSAPAAEKKVSGRYIMSFSASFSLKDNDNLLCSAQGAVRDGYTASCTVEVQKLEQEEWQAVKRWVVSDINYVAMKKMLPASGGEYRLRVIFCSLDSDRNTLEDSFFYTPSVTLG